MIPWYLLYFYILNEITRHSPGKHDVLGLLSPLYLKLDCLINVKQYNRITFFKNVYVYSDKSALVSLLHLRRMPSLLEYLSYNCNFMGILAGPTCSYNDYMAFIEGTCYQPRHQENANGKENGKYKQSEPSPKVGHTAVEMLRSCKR